jgi:hypothetical protein
MRFVKCVNMGGFVMGVEKEETYAEIRRVDPYGETMPDATEEEIAAQLTLMQDDEYVRKLDVEMERSFRQYQAQQRRQILH